MMTVEWIAVLAALPLLVSGDKIVTTKSGSVQSTTVQVTFGRNVEAFLGIPFAEPPVGKLRFTKPVPISPWDGVYDASSLPPPCYQNYTKKFYWVPSVERMTEDCLYLNLWVPGNVQNPAKLKAVLLWIHGGAFNTGSSEMDIVDGSTLSGYGDVIVASFNYRVGVFGFLRTPIESAPGNMGIYDQILAMKWIKDNVEAFGGDPELITLIGESAGAMSVGFHLLSPLTKGLFKRAIMESGGPVHPKSIESLRLVNVLSEKIARLSGCADGTVNMTTDPQLVVDCLRHLEPNVLSEAEGILVLSQAISAMPFWGDEFMPRNPTDLAREGLFHEAEVLIGTNTDEGSFFLTVILPDYFGVYGANPIPKLKKGMANFIMHNIFKQTEQTNVEEITNHYVPMKRKANLPANNSTGDLKQILYNSLGDYLILCSTMFFAEYLSMQRVPVYYYVFSHRPNVTFTADWMGVTHFEEVQYVFGVPFRKESEYPESERTISQKIMDRWLTFAKTGNPNMPEATEWPLYEWNNPLYLDISMTDEVKVRPDHNRCEFWRDRFQSKINASVALQLSSASSIQTSSFMMVFLLTVLRSCTLL